MPQIDLSILNQRQTPAFYADVLANRPAAGFIGRIFVSTNTFEFYRDNGTGWDLIGGPGAGTITGSGAAGQVSFWNGASTITGSNDLFWDNVNGHLGIGTITPGTALSIAHDQNQVVQLNQTTATNDTKIAFQNSGTALWRIGNSYGGGTNRFVVTDAALNINRFSVLPSSGQTFVGDVVTSSGLFVVNSNSGDAHIVALGATAPSIRVRNAGTGATLQFGLGLATITNNFIQGSTGGEFCIFNDSLTAQPILFGIKDAGSGNTLEAARISAARNLIVNSTTDSGERLQVNGTTIIKSGLGNVATNAFQITGSGGNLLNIRGFGDLFLNGLGASITIGSTTNIGVGTFNLNSNQGTGNSFFSLIHNNSNTAIRVLSNSVIQLNPVAGNVLIGTTTDAGYRLDCNGIARVQTQFVIFRNQSVGDIDLNFNNNQASWQGGIYYRTESGGGSRRLSFYTNGGAGTGDKLTIWNDSGNVVIQNGGTFLDPVNSILTLNSTSKGFLPPRMTTAQKTAIATPATGLVVYDTTLNKLAVFTGVNWETVTSV